MKEILMKHYLIYIYLLYNDRHSSINSFKHCILHILFILI